MKLALGLLGLLMALVILAEAFEAMVLPRRVIRFFRFTRLYYRAVWRVWGALSATLPGARRREALLSIFGPLSLLGLFVLWATGLIVGFALMHHALAPDDVPWEVSLYLSGTTFPTLGYGDVTPASPAARILAVVEAVTGFGFFAVVIGYLPALYQAFSGRETLISLLDARAGSPPSAGRLLLRAPPGAGMYCGSAALGRFLEESERWSAILLESHLSYPVLAFYRSQHDNQSWLAALVCSLDTSALLLTVIDGGDRHQARLTFAMGRHALVDLALIFRQEPAGKEAPDRLPPQRLRALLAAVRHAGGQTTPADDEASVAELAELRALYEPFAAALARFFRLTVPDVYPEDDRPDNWQTSAWMRRASPLTGLGARPANDDHFD